VPRAEEDDGGCFSECRMAKYLGFWPVQFLMDDIAFKESS
jgi:hypothetical protein